MRRAIALAMAITALLLLAGCAAATATHEPPPPSATIPELLTANPSAPVTQALLSPLAGPLTVTATPPPTHTTFLPLAERALPDAYAPEIRDCSGQVTGTQFLANFCAVTWTLPVSTSRLAALWPCCGNCPAVHVVHVTRADQTPAEGIPVVLWWPDAPWLPAELYNCGRMKGVVGWTNANGDVGFGLGGGAYCWRPAAGPHGVWVGSGSNCLDGVGMNAATNHEHLDSWWTVTDAQVAAAAAIDHVYVQGTLVYTETVYGREMPVVRWPDSGQ